MAHLSGASSSSSPVKSTMSPPSGLQYLANESAACRMELNHLLPTPPTQIHDAFGNQPDKDNPQVNQEKDLQLPPSPGTPSQRKRTFSEMSGKDGEEEPHVPTADFELYSDVRESRRTIVVTEEEATTLRQSNMSLEARQKAYEARHPVYTPAQWYNDDRMGLYTFLVAEHKQRQEEMKLELARAETRKRNAPKKAARTSAIAAAKQRSLKRRRVADDEEEAPTAPNTRSSPRSPKEANLSLTEDAPVPHPGAAGLETTELDDVSSTVPVSRTESQQPSHVVKPTIATRPTIVKPAGAKPAGIVKTKPVSKAKIAKPTTPLKKPVKKGKEGTMTEHSTAIKEALKQRMLNHGNSKDKGAYHLYNDAYMPSGSIEGKDLPKPGRDNMPPPKALNAHDQYFGDLHPLERQLAERIRLTPIEYLTQKSRYFLGTGEWFRLGHEKLNKAHAQVFCNQDGNNTSEMHQVYETWGWNDPSNWSEDVINNLRPLTDCKLHSTAKK